MCNPKLNPLDNLMCVQTEFKAHILETVKLTCFCHLVELLPHHSLISQTFRCFVLLKLESYLLVIHFHSSNKSGSVC